MKRSDIDEILRERDAFIRSFGYALPPVGDVDEDVEPWRRLVPDCVTRLR